MTRDYRSLCYPDFETTAPWTAKLCFDPLWFIRLFTCATSLRWNSTDSSDISSPARGSRKARRTCSVAMLSWNRSPSGPRRAAVTSSVAHSRSIAVQSRVCSSVSSLSGIRLEGTTCAEDASEEVFKTEIECIVQLPRLGRRSRHTHTDLHPREKLLVDFGRYTRVVRAVSCQNAMAGSGTSSKGWKLRGRA